MAEKSSSGPNPKPNKLGEVLRMETDEEFLILVTPQVDASPNQGSYEQPS